jgi:monofunctional biosynthetic peptidoglycan transglycosylase
LAVVLLTLTLIQWATWPDVAELASSNPRSTAFIDIYRPDDGGTALRWAWVDGARISPELWKAVVVAEDVEFFTHQGFSISELRTAIRQAWEERRAPRGASTITQQLAKNLWLSPSRNPWRKVKEALLTLQLEQHLSKRRILELYLNVVEFGPGTYGAEAAARHYFGKSAAGLTTREAALLAAGLPRPASWHPGVTRNAYLASADRIEYRMFEYRDYLDRHLAR